MFSLSLATTDRSSWHERARRRRRARHAPQQRRQRCPVARTASPSPCAAACIGALARSTLAADIVDETRRTGTIGTQSPSTSSTPPGRDSSPPSPPRPTGALDIAHVDVIARDDAIRDAFLDQAVTGLRAALGG